MGSNRFISGIYNYCDYWCERCAYTRRCRNYQMDPGLKRRADGQPPPIERDAANAAFWADLAEAVRETELFGPADARDREAGLPDDLQPDSEWLAREEAHRAAVQQHPLVRMAFDYMKRVEAWQSTADPDLKAVARGLLEAAKSPVPNPAEEEAREIGDMIEIATWYHTLIPPKLSRALDGVFEKDGLDDDPTGVLAETRQHDANGSARVVLLAIERSIAAWTRLRTLVPAQGDAILDLLVPLDRMRGGIHLILPGAQQFPLAFLGEFSEPPTNA